MPDTTPVTDAHVKRQAARKVGVERDARILDVGDARTRANNAQTSANNAQSRADGAHTRIDGLTFTGIGGTLGGTQVPDKMVTNRMIGDGQVDRRAIAMIDLRTGPTTGLDNFYTQHGHGHPFTSITGQIAQAQIAQGTLTDAMHAGNFLSNRHIPDGLIGGLQMASTFLSDRHFPDGVVTARIITPNLNNPGLTVPGLRSIGSFWGGDSTQAASGNHSHSISYKELPPSLRQKITASRDRLHRRLLPKSDMRLLSSSDLADRVWLLERQMAGVLHLLCDDPSRPTSEREAAIAAGEEEDTHDYRYGGEKAYEEQHPQAAHLFAGFTVEEMDL